MLHYHATKFVKGNKHSDYYNGCEKGAVHMAITYITEFKNNIGFFFLMWGVIFTTLAEMVFHFTNNISVFDALLSVFQKRTNKILCIAYILRFKGILYLKKKTLF